VLRRAVDTLEVDEEMYQRVKLEDLNEPCRRLGIKTQLRPVSPLASVGRGRRPRRAAPALARSSTAAECFAGRASAACSELAKCPGASEAGHGNRRRRTVGVGGHPRTRGHLMATQEGWRVVVADDYVFADGFVVGFLQDAERGLVDVGG
jgi:hypothetical protein